ncbi:hypothetical protein JCR32_02830 [Bacillus sp. HNR-4]|uniref:hypothetical protein n=1 Tax=Bacillus sp. HNR-4 TaxID=2796141 RepID=UPI002379F137|nr:hypothetical protein [Bacillus sp. HNR-4]WDL92797.1 hypothetical protein JCR32_02830 [Bacillus sp. HNR-4]
MTTIIKNEETFIIEANIREANMNRTEVLEKVKELLLLPNLEMATTRQVADFYEVPVKTIQTIHARHLEEIKSDGHVTKTGKALANELVTLNMKDTKITNKRGYILVECGEYETTFPHSTIGLFPRRAILRIGMLLRDSEVAKEVRTQLLNIEEKATSEAKVTDIDEEIQLQMAVNQAIMTGDINALAHASEKLIEFKSRHITEIKNKLQEQKTVIQTLAKEEVRYKTRGQILRKLVNRYSVVIYGTIGTNKGWQDLCSHLVNKLDKGINLKSRRTKARRSNPRASYISVIRPEEFKIIIPAMVGMCASSDVDVSNIMKDA